MQLFFCLHSIYNGNVFSYLQTKKNLTTVQVQVPQTIDEKKKFVSNHLSNIQNTKRDKKLLSKKTRNMNYNTKNFLDNYTYKSLFQNTYFAS